MRSDYDPLGHEDFESPHAEFARLRRECPVAHSEAFDGFWLLTRYQDVVDVLSRPEDFTTTVRNVVPGSSTTGRRPPLHLDPPEHTPYRKALERALSRARVSSLIPAIERHADTLVTALVDQGGGDFVELVGSPLPALVFGDWMGLTPEQTQELWGAARTYVKAWEDFDRGKVTLAGDQLAALASDVIADRRARPRDPETDPTSALLQAQDADGGPLPDLLLAGCVRQVLVVGLVAPPILLGSIVVHLAREPDLHDRLRAEPDLLEPAVEEFLRLYTPYRGFARTSRAPTVIGGRPIGVGEPIALAYASANRDETVFDDPHAFRLHRPNISRHFAFGQGPHRCVGMPVARLELLIALRTLVQQTRRIELVGPVKMAGMPEVGPIAVPVRVVR